MRGYPPMEELYLGCECMDLNHVALFIHFPPKDDVKSVIEDEDDAPCIYCSVTAKNYYTHLLPEIRYLFDKWTWQNFAYHNWYQRWWIAAKYIFNPTYTKRYGILDAFDFQHRDHDKLDAFLTLISSDIDNNIDEKSELWVDDDQGWIIRFQPTRLIFEKHDIVEPWQIGWDIQFMKKGFFGRIKYAFKYIFGRHCSEKNFTLLEKDASKIRGMIKWVQETNKKDKENE